MEAQLRQARKLIRSVLIAFREQNEHGLRLEAPRHEGEHLGRGAIQPLGVVHEADEWLCFGCVRQQAQHREADEEPGGRRAGAQTERRAKRLALGHRQRLEAVQQRQEELM